MCGVHCFNTMGVVIIFYCKNDKQWTKYEQFKFIVKQPHDILLIQYARLQVSEVC